MRRRAPAAAAGDVPASPPPHRSRPVDLELRPAVVDDLEPLLALYAELAEEPEPDRAGGDASRPVLERILAQPGRHLTVAVRDAHVVASADMLVVENLTHGASPWAIVENVIVTSSQRRMGVGRALLEHLVSQARAAGAYKVQLLSAQRRQARAFYEGLGFRELSHGFKLYLEPEHGGA